MCIDFKHKKIVILKNIITKKILDKNFCIQKN